MDKTATYHTGLSPVLVPHADRPGQETMFEIEFLAVRQDINGFEIEPFASNGSESQAKPIRHIH
jgi:hypothetical protein